MSALKEELVYPLLLSINKGSVALNLLPFILRQRRYFWVNTPEKLQGDFWSVSFRLLGLLETWVTLPPLIGPLLQRFPVVHIKYLMHWNCPLTLANIHSSLKEKLSKASKLLTNQPHGTMEGEAGGHPEQSPFLLPPWRGYQLLLKHLSGVMVMWGDLASPLNKIEHQSDSVILKTPVDMGCSNSR